MNKKIPSRGFTIVELLVVIVIIGILAAITIVSYTGITSKAVAASLQADLANASKKLKIWQISESPDGNFPASISDCVNPTPAAGNMCLKKSNGDLYDAYTQTTGATPTFTLDATEGATTYRITDNTAPTAVAANQSLAVTDPANWLAVGAQVWGKYNLNVGSMVPVSSDQTDNSIVEKYCYDDNEANCTTYGGLYQWNEAMQYVTTEGAGGICPAGSHIPSDAELMTLTTYLGAATAGTQMKVGGTSGLEVPLGGFRVSVGYSYDVSSTGYLWSSSESGADAMLHYLMASSSTVERGSNSKATGYSVRCIGN